MSLPRGVYPVRKRLASGAVATYWYHQEGRHLPKTQRGPLTRLPDPNTQGWFEALARLGGADIAMVDRPAGTIATVIEAYKARKWPSLRPNTKALYNVALGYIETAWGRLRPDQISIGGITALQGQFADRPTMGNQVMVQVRAIMKLAVQMELRSDNPAREVDDLTEKGDGAKPLTPEAWAALQSAPEMLRRLGVIGRATGQRIGDLIRMEPRHRDEEGIVTTITKTHDRPHWCPLSAAERKTMDGWKAFATSPYIGLNGGKRFTERKVRRLWHEYAATSAGKALVGFTPHDLRATKVCDERIAGYSHQQIAARVGMSLQMVMRYSRHIDQRMAARGTKTERELRTGVDR